MLYYTYVLKSQIDGKLYVGFTADLQQRLAAHQSGSVTATKNRLPVDLIYFEACRDKNKALKREQYFKTGFGRRFLKDRI